MRARRLFSTFFGAFRASKLTVSVLASCLFSCGAEPKKPAESPPSSEGDVGFVLQPFPPRSFLEKLLAQPKPEFPVQLQSVPVKSWTITAPVASTFADEDKDAAAPSALARKIAAAHGAPVVVSSALRCAAQEFSRFRNMHAGTPSDLLRDYLTARCGWPFPVESSGIWTAKVTKAMSTDAVLAQLAPKVEADVAHAVSSGPGALGVGVDRDDEHLTLTWMFSSPRVALDPAPIRRDGFVAHVRGRFSEAPSQVQALVNGDGFSVKACVAEAASVGSFSYACPLPTAASPTWIDIVAAEPGALVTRVVVRAVVHDGDDASLTWEAPPAPTTQPLTDASSLGATVLAPLNELRVALGEGPLVLAPAQSEMEAKISPYLLAAYEKDTKTTDDVFLALMAGWDVRGGAIRDGKVSFVTATSHDAGDWLAAALARPLGRSILLDPAAHQLAVGGEYVGEGGMLAAIVSTYSFFRGAEHPELADFFAQRLGLERRAANRSVPTRVGGLDGISRAARAVSEDGADLSALLHDALVDASTRTGRSFKGVAIPTVFPEKTAAPAELSSAESPTFAVAVGHHKPKGAAWGEYVVFWLWTEGA